MTTVIQLIKSSTGGLNPFQDGDRDAIKDIKSGQIISAQISLVRNSKFHRKFFALLKLAYEAWEPKEQTYKGMVVQKNFDRFRKDIVILAGYVDDPVININEEVRVEAKSISFGKMDEIEFGELYRAVLNKLWDLILQQSKYKDIAEVERVLEEMLRFE